VSDLPSWLQQTLHVLCVLVPYGIFFAVCLWAINWQKMGPTLREGASLPLVLLLVLVALVWSQIKPTDIMLFGVISVGNFWWQLGATGLLAALGLFAGWIQDRYHWYPQEVPTAPPAHDHGHDDHGQGHH
jgi:hypothetical protein